MSLFSLSPKESPKELFGREKEIEELTRLLSARRWVALLGPRMVGKTSLIKATNVKLERAGIKTIYINLWSVKGTQGLLSALTEGINNQKSLMQKIKATTGKIDGLSFGPGGISLSIVKKPMTTTKDLLASIGRQTDECVIELDEVQELYAISGQLLKILANIFNTYRNLTFVFTGSMFGLTRTLLEPESTSPLYGRSPAKMILQPFDPKTASGFLIKGLRECNETADKKKISEAIEILDGIPGWLTLYGNNLVVRQLTHQNALRETVAEAGKIVNDEVEHFLQRRDRTLYIAALKAAANSARWREIKTAIETAKGTTVNDSTIRNTIENLKAAMLITEKDKVYRVTDPMLQSLLRTSKIT
jgi:AAA+ ATPase superfamily predicted ATPase